MPRHQDRVVSFDVPRDWEDRSVIAYRAPSEQSGLATNIVVTRDVLGANEDLLAYAERNVDALAAKVDELEVLDCEEQYVARQLAIVAKLVSGKGEEAVLQRMLFVELPRRRVVTVTLTARRDDEEQCSPLFDRIVSSVSFAEAHRVAS